MPKQLCMMKWNKDEMWLGKKAFQGHSNEHTWSDMIYWLIPSNFSQLAYAFKHHSVDFGTKDIYKANLC